MFRSFLIVPAIKMGRFWEHLRALPEDCLPDCIVIDLEDSIPPNRKSEALDILLENMGGVLLEPRKAVPLMVKVDNPASRYFEDQIRTLKSISEKCHSVKIGKVSGCADLEAVKTKIAGSRLKLMPTIETPAGFLNRNQILSWCRQNDLKYASFGAGDMASSLLIARSYELDTLKHIFSELVVACAIHSIVLVDSPSRVIPKSRVLDWRAEIARECAWAFANGAKSKTAIHPMQIPIIHQVWTAHFDVARADSIEAQFRSEPGFRSLVDNASGEYMGTPSLAAAQRLKALVASAGNREADEG